MAVIVIFPLLIAAGSPPVPVTPLTAIRSLTCNCVSVGAPSGGAGPDTRAMLATVSTQNPPEFVTFVMAIVPGAIVSSASSVNPGLVRYPIYCPDIGTSDHGRSLIDQSNHRILSNSPAAPCCDL